MSDSETGSQPVQNWNPRLGQAELDAALTSLGQLEQVLPFLVGLGREERARLSKVGDRTRPFLQDAVNTALANPGLLPRSVDMERLRLQAETLAHLGTMRARIAQLLEKVSDTETRLGSEVYGITRAIYSVMKTPATVPGLNEQKARLAKRFARKAKNRSNELPTAA